MIGYRDPPAGVAVAEGQHYNPYFAGGKIQMPPPIYDGGVEYEDGTEANASQMAKDVTTFLQWAAEPEQDERKLMGTAPHLHTSSPFPAHLHISSSLYADGRWELSRTT